MRQMDLIQKTRPAYNVTSIFNSIYYVRVKVRDIVFLTVISGNYSHNEKKVAMQA